MRDNKACLSGRQQGWVTDLKRLLFTEGFGHVRISDGVGDENKFLHQLSLRLADIAKLEIRTYRRTVKFRISGHSLMIEKGRHHAMLREDQICKQCDIGCVEDEFHFLLVCHKYNDLREQYLPKYHTNNPNLRKFVAILCSNKGEILEVCPFISTKALECVMVLEKTINIYHWASQGGLVGLRAWSGFGVAAWWETMFIFQRECCLDFGTSLSGLGCTCRDLRNWSVVV